jgi:phosphoglycerate-specific signal transduction histidine kinase
MTSREQQDLARLERIVVGLTEAQRGTLETLRTITESYKQLLEELPRVAEALQDLDRRMARLERERGR